MVSQLGNAVVAQCPAMEFAGGQGISTRENAYGYG
jgi:hypothetical protein